MMKNIIVCETWKKKKKNKEKLTFSFSTKSTKVVLSISTGWPCLSYKASTKWKKLDLRRLEGGCFSKCARASPTPLRTQAQTSGVRDEGG